LKIGHITILVHDIAEALTFYVEKLGFVKRMDTKLSLTMRWVTVSPEDQLDLELTFVLADTEEKKRAVGKQAADHIFLTLQTDDIQRDYQKFKAKGVNFLMKPETQVWGIEAVFEDLYGNLYDLVQRK
jgi:catechol 2,3-dioxygenase-like lactoylglutathione lyase family enzyme